eukprot:TRINITY_DN2248_c0_g1_i1.p1 TRINITY_DN2248_c0_g1~~TRINITY_DN2248_c0_g1_i1.p1  ORF type:complete len:799 (+),score=65.06 TRINITY_DN2248_c0_g1_i1:10532-12928(+)
MRLRKIRERGTSVSQETKKPLKSSYEVFSSIYENDKSLLEEELKDLNRILELKKKQVKEISDAKPFLFAQIKQREQHQAESGIELDGRASVDDIVILKGRYGYSTQQQNTPANVSPTSKFVRRDPPLSPYKIANNKTVYNSCFPVRKPEAKRADTVTLPNTPGCASTYPYKNTNIKYSKARTNPHTVYGSIFVNDLRKNAKSLQEPAKLRAVTCIAKRGRRPALIRRKMAKFERVLGTAGCDQQANKPPSTKKTLLLEEYKQQRFKRTEKILEEIDTTEPSIIKPLYQYKLKSILNLEEEVYQMRDHLHEMLRDPRRPVAKIERQKRARKKIIQLHRKVKSKPIQNRNILHSNNYIKTTDKKQQILNMSSVYVSNSPEAQRATITAEISRRALKACYMVHKPWWDAWRKHVNFEGQGADGEPSPGPITNTELVQFFSDKADSELKEEEYINAFNNDHVQGYEALDDWRKIKLKEGLKEDVDFILVSYKVWYGEFQLIYRNMMHWWYRGGPEIRIPLIGDKETPKSYGEPDLNPVTLLYYVQSGAEQSQVKGMLTSLWTTCENLKAYIAELIDKVPSGFLLRFQGATTKSSIYLKSTKETLAEKGVSAYTILTVDLLPSQGHTKKFCVEKEYGYDEEITYKVCNIPTMEACTAGKAIAEPMETEEEMMKIAIAESLKDYGQLADGILIDQKLLADDGVKDSSDVSGNPYKKLQTFLDNSKMASKKKLVDKSDDKTKEFDSKYMKAQAVIKEKRIKIRRHRLKNIHRRLGRMLEAQQFANGVHTTSSTKVIAPNSSIYIL